MRNTNRSEGVQATGRGNSVTSAPQQPDIIPLKEVEKHAILVAVRRLGVQGAAIALGVGKTTIHRKLREWQLRPPRVGIGMADCSNNKTEYITQRGSEGNRISKMVPVARWHRVSASSWMQRFRSFRAWRIAGQYKSAEADKSVADAARSSVRPVYRCIKACTEKSLS